MINGIPLIPDSSLPELLPVLKLSHDAPVTEKFRREFNAWLLEQFGEERVVFPAGNGGFAMHPNNLQHIREMLHETLV